MVKYVVARSHTGRATLQHKVSTQDINWTSCGYDISPWSRHYMSERIEVILCKKPGCYG